MSDSLRTDRQRALDAASEADRDAKIEQLLLVGLDHYFAAQYDQAINVWTRALFLDRSHARARAYIDRARNALAERQRKSEELLQTGVAAFERGEGSEARRLLHEAVAGGAPPDEALAVLDRLDRLETTAPGGVAAPSRGERRRPAPRQSDGRRRVRIGTALAWSMPVMVAVAAWAVVAQGRLDWRRWIPLEHAPAGAAARPSAGDAVLPLPRRGETALTRARALTASGHLRDALIALDGVRTTDPQKGDADRLRSDIQRQLLALAAPASTSAPDRERGDRRVP